MFGTTNPSPEGSTATSPSLEAALGVAAVASPKSIGGPRRETNPSPFPTLKRAVVRTDDDRPK